MHRSLRPCCAKATWDFARERIFLLLLLLSLLFLLLLLLSLLFLLLVLLLSLLFLLLVLLLSLLFLLLVLLLWQMLAACGTSSLLLLLLMLGLCMLLFLLLLLLLLQLMLRNLRLAATAEDRLRYGRVNSTAPRFQGEGDTNPTSFCLFFLSPSVSVSSLSPRSVSLAVSSRLPGCAASLSPTSASHLFLMPLSLLCILSLSLSCLCLFPVSLASLSVLHLSLSLCF